MTHQRWAVIFAATIFAVGCKGGGAEGKENGPKTGKVVRGTLEVVLTEVGSIEPESKVEVKSLLGGKVKEVLVHAGDAVKTGDTLAWVEPDVDQIRNLSSLRTGLTKAKIEIRNAEIDLANMKALAEKNFSSAEELRSVERIHESARVDYQTLEAQVRLLEQGGITLPSGEAGASTSQAFKIIASNDGIILESRVQAGEAVVSGSSGFGGGTALFVLADLTKLLIKATVNEVDVGKIATDQAVSVSVDAYRGQKFDGKVTRVSPGARMNGAVRVFDLEARVDDSAHVLRPGMTANLDVHGEKRDKVLKVAIEGVFRKKGKDVVFRVKHLDKDAKKKKVAEVVKKGPALLALALAGLDYDEVEVKTALSSIEEIEISSGLSEGDEIFLEDPTVPRKEPNFN